MMQAGAGREPAFSRFAAAASEASKALDEATAEIHRLDRDG